MWRKERGGSGESLARSAEKSLAAAVNFLPPPLLFFLCVSGGRRKTRGESPPPKKEEAGGGGIVVGKLQCVHCPGDHGKRQEEKKGRRKLCPSDSQMSRQIQYFDGMK